MQHPRGDTVPAIIERRVIGAEIRLRRESIFVCDYLAKGLFGLFAVPP
jgi:hypothetical protein